MNSMDNRSLKAADMTENTVPLTVFQKDNTTAIEQRLSEILVQMAHIRDDEQRYVSEYVQRYDPEEYDMQLIYKRRREAEEKYTKSSKYKKLQVELRQLAERTNLQK